MAEVTPAGWGAGIASAKEARRAARRDDLVSIVAVVW